MLFQFYSSRQLNLDAKIKSPASVASSSMLSPTSSKEPSPFRFPDSNMTIERRDSIFCGPGDLSKLVKPVTPITNASNVDLGTPNHSSTTLTPGTAQQNNGQPHGSFSSVAISSSALLGTFYVVTNFFREVLYRKWKCARPKWGGQNILCPSMTLYDVFHLEDPVGT